MKRLATILTLLACAASLSAQSISFTKMFNEADGFQGREFRFQGATICGDLLFQFQDGNRPIMIYNLPGGELAGEIALEPIPTYHNNNVETSATYYADGDEFPVIYASQENKAQHKIVAYRITREDGKFAAQIVQTINLPAPIETGQFYTNLILDLQGRALYVTGYSRENWHDPSNGNGLVLLQYKMPSLREGSEVNLGTDKIVRRLNADFRTATQGATIRNGRIYQVFGVPKYGTCSFCCTSLEDGRLLWEYPLPEAGFPNEPECLSFWGDTIVAGDGDGNVFRSDLVVPWEFSPDLATTAPALARGAKKKLVCMDLDATLTQHRTQLEDFNLEALTSLDHRYQCVMVCAGNAPRVRKQMNDYPIDILANYGMQEAHDVDGQLQIVRQTTIPADTAFFVKKCNYLRQKYGYTDYDGEGIEFHAAGMVTFGLLGVDAKPEKKVVFDPDRAKRRVMYPEVIKIFGKKYCVFIGGSSSFDFAPKPFNKYDASLQYAKEHGISKDEIIFIGDDFGDGGGDSHVRINGMDYICIDDYHNFPEKVLPLLLAK